MVKIVHTHHLAVNAFLIFDDRFLLLKRVQEPHIWTPPGGRLYANEDPHEGLQREVREETDLNIRIFQPVTTWFGEFNGRYLLSIDYLCTTQQSMVHLSVEHCAYRWLSVEDLVQEQNFYFNSAQGFQLRDFSLAWRTYLFNENRYDELRQYPAKG